MERQRRSTRGENVKNTLTAILIVYLLFVADIVCLFGQVAVVPITPVIQPVVPYVAPVVPVVPYVAPVVPVSYVTPVVQPVYRPVFSAFFGPTWSYHTRYVPVVPYVAPVYVAPAPVVQQPIQQYQ